jgi:hypothetical protein
MGVLSEIWETGEVMDDSAADAVVGLFWQFPKHRDTNILS